MRSDALSFGIVYMSSYEWLIRSWMVVFGARNVSAPSLVYANREFRVEELPSKSPTPIHFLTRNALCGLSFL